MSRRRSRPRLSPAWMPWIRDQLVKRHRRAIELQRADPRTPSDIGLMLARSWDMYDSLSTGQLWWVSRDMTFLALDTVMNGPLPPGVVAPAHSGLMSWQGGSGLTMRSPLGSVTVDAAIWTVSHGGNATVKALTSDGDVRERCGDSDIPLTPIPIDPRSTDSDRKREARAVEEMTQTVWALALQPSIASQRDSAWTDGDGPCPPRYAGGDAPRAKMIVLRESASAPVPHDAGSGGTVQWDHRWIVRGYYRSQQYGPENSLRRRQWIPPFVKGPQGLPIIDRPQVMIWRR